MQPIFFCTKWGHFRKVKTEKLAEILRSQQYPGSSASGGPGWGSSSGPVPYSAPGAGQYPAAGKRALPPPLPTWGAYGGAPQYSVAGYPSAYGK